MRALKRRPSPALIISVVALCAALVGTAIAGPIAGDSRLTRQDRKVAVKIARTLSLRYIKRFTPLLSDRQIAKAAPGLSVESAKEADSAKTVADGAITTEKLADLAVTTDKIGDNQVTGAKVNEATLGQVPSAANASFLGGISAAGYARRIFARVSYDAGGTSLIAASPGVVALTETGLGFPKLSFPQSMNNCAVVASASSNTGTQIIRRSTNASGTTVQFAIKDEEENAVRADFDVIASC